jgi:alpha-1,3-rhamnosyl/mannosyltransferase
VFHAPHVFSALPAHGASVVTIHDLIPLHPQHRPAARTTRLLYPRLLRRALGSATVVLTPSSEMRDALLRRSGDRSAGARRSAGPLHVEVTPYAADASFVPAPPQRVNELRARLRLPDSYALCVANIRPHKNLSRLLRAWASLDNEQRRGCELVVAGGLDSAAATADAGRPRHAAASNPALRTAATTMVGPIDEADMPALYSGATLMIHPALMEGFGLPVAEAMACGVPVVCSDAPSLDGACGDAALRCDAASHENIAAAIAGVLASSEFRERLAAAGLRQASSLSWQRTAELTLAAYETARGIAGNPTAGA